MFKNGEAGDSHLNKGFGFGFYPGTNKLSSFFTPDDTEKFFLTLIGELLLLEFDLDDLLEFVFFSLYF